MNACRVALKRTNTSTLAVLKPSSNFMKTVLHEIVICTGIRKSKAAETSCACYCRLRHLEVPLCARLSHTTVTAHLTRLSRCHLKATCFWPMTILKAHDQGTRNESTVLSPGSGTTEIAIGKLGSTTSTISQQVSCQCCRLSCMHSSSPLFETQIAPHGRRVLQWAASFAAFRGSLCWSWTFAVD